MAADTFKNNCGHEVPASGVNYCPICGAEVKEPLSLEVLNKSLQNRYQELDELKKELSKLRRRLERIDQ